MLYNDVTKISFVFFIFFFRVLSILNAKTDNQLGFNRSGLHNVA